MNIRKLLGRLCAMSPKFGGARGGGIPEFTPQDIAAALGMVEDVIGREIFCLAWWPEGANLMRGELHKMIRDMLLDEFSRRYREREDARLRQHLMGAAKPDLKSRPVERLDAEVKARERSIWPSVIDKYDQIANAVFKEICTPQHCSKCMGRGTALDGALMVKCDVCRGTGLSGASKSWRARQLDMDESTYRRYWSHVYEWAFDAVAQRESTTAKRVVDALGYGANEAA